jgi:GWxTD domain-containing protein
MAEATPPPPSADPPDVAGQASGAADEEPLFPPVDGDTPPPAPVSLPAAPQPGEGKSGRLLMEPMSEAPGARELTPLPDDPAFRKALRTWDEGPVRYIILKEEQDLFWKLETDEDRLRFIQDFWARRDSLPTTPVNEYREEFWRRVSEAERRFIDSPKTGWKTDRGRIWIVMGPPDELDNYSSRRMGTGVLRWIYRNRPNLLLEPNFIVAFRQTYSGEWEISNDPRDFDPVFRDLRSNIKPYWNQTSIASAYTPNLGEVKEVQPITFLSLYMDIGAAVAPPELYRLRETTAVVETRETFGTLDMRTSFEFLGADPDGRVRTGIVLGILKGSLVSETDPDEGDANLSIDMSLYAGETEDTDTVIRLPAAFGPSRENYVALLSGRLLFRTETALDPGKYLAVYRVLDRTSGQSAQARETFTVPPRFDEGLQLSTVVLADRLAAIDLDAERPDAFTLGRFRVVPNVEATYRNGRTFAFYYQVNGASYDPRTGRRRLDVEYAFAVAQADGWLELGESLIYRDQTNPQGWSVPLAGWPPASYRLTVKVTDVVSGDTTSNHAFFRVIPGA